MEFVVRGIFDNPLDNDSMYFNIEYLFESVSNRRRDSTGIFVSLIDNASDAPRISKEIDEIFRNAPDQTRTETEKAFQLGFISMLGQHQDAFC
jgi:putative ABC transport system permease protein